MLHVEKKIYIHRFFRDFTPFAPFMAIYFAHLGLSVSAISFLFVVWSCTSIVLEVPTGIIGDRYDRKTVLVIAQSAKLLSFLVWLIFPSFVGFLAGIILWGIAASLDSGTFQAFLYDVVRGDQNKDTFGKMYSKATSASFAGLFIATILASFLIRFGFQYLLSLSIVGLSISLAVLFFLPSIPKVKTGNIIPTLSSKTVIRNIGLIWNHKTLLLLMVIGVSAAGFKPPLDEYHALFFDSRGISLFVVGLIIASLELIKSFGSFLVTKIPAKDHYQHVILLTIGILLFGIAFTPAYIAIALLGILTFIDMFLWMWNDIAIQHIASGHNRATLQSIKTFTGEVITVGMFGIFSVATNYYSVSSVYAISGILLVIISAVVLVLKPRSYYTKMTISDR